VAGRRRLSESISEGEGISVLVHIAEPAGVAVAEAHGAEGIVVDEVSAGIRQASSLPLLAGGGSPEHAQAEGADAWLLVVEQHADALTEPYEAAEALGLECVIDVRDEEELEHALERTDPEIVLLSPRGAEHDEDAVDRILELLPDVPAGMLAVAELHGASREDVLALERAGVDAVLVSAGDLPGIATESPAA
jgi:indole-3-glycerol phosphate synthase